MRFFSARRGRTFWLFIGALVAAAAILHFGFRPGSASDRAAHTGELPASSDGLASDETSAVTVVTVRPLKGDMDRVTVQAGTVQPFESVQLYSGVSGFLKSQSVDIGDHVKRGQVLATVDVPDLEKKVQRLVAGVEQSVARVAQMQARVETARAELKVAAAAITFAEANAKSKAAELRFREKQLGRMRDLFLLKSIDERLVDEKHEQRDTAQEGERAARASVVSANALLAAAESKIKQADADLLEARTSVKVAQAELEKEQVMVRFATITAPCDGVITHRALFPGDFVRAADAGGQSQPMLTIQLIDKFRVVVQVPDRDVPYTNPGDPAEVEVDALPGKKFSAKVSRIAQTEDQQTRLMRVEIDLPNSNGRICAGMYGRVKILLEKSDLLSVPSSSLTGKSENGRATLYVVRNGAACKVPVRISEDNGVKVGILSGLTADDVVISNAPVGLADGTPVAVAAQVDKGVNH